MWQWEDDYIAATRAVRASGENTGGKAELNAIIREMDNADGGSGPQRRKESAKRRQQKRDGERRQKQPGGPGGSPPPNPPKQGGKGYSDDDEERRLEWEFDDAMRRRMQSKDGSIDDVLERAHALQQYRAANGITGRLDERFGRPFDTGERIVVDTLLSEGRNVSSIAVQRTGDATPDMAVDGRIAEIKASISSNVANFAGRVTEAWDEQGAPYVFVNATRSKVTRAEMEREMQAIVSRGDSMYIRIIGDGYDSEFGKW